MDAAIRRGTGRRLADRALRLCLRHFRRDSRLGISGHRRTDCRPGGPVTVLSRRRGRRNRRRAQRGFVSGAEFGQLGLNSADANWKRNVQRNETMDDGTTVMAQVAKPIYALWPLILWRPLNVRLYHHFHSEQKSRTLRN